MLEDHLVLHGFLCREFGYDNLATMLERLRDVRAGMDAGGESHYFRGLFPDTQIARIAPEILTDYDVEIATLSRRLRMTGDRGRGWKPHQWLALLFAEHYLRHYFDDPDLLRDELNAAKRQDPRTAPMPNYTVADLRTVAVQSATGSGKTLVMHAHILQYRRLARAAGRPPNNVILVTPNEQLSAQHERELRDSNLPARLFSSEAGSDLLAPVEIIDLNKLAEKKGVKRVAVRDFGDNNLVLVDEGHLGATGKTWRARRRELAEGGFTFEYSATFNQIVGNDASLLNAYGKSLIFDYPYRTFHADGYGKDYAISNLPQGAEDENSNIYLLGCLLSFYRQSRIWRDRGALWVDFNVTRPLWVFLGKTVTGSAKADRDTRSDVLRILGFLGWVLAHGDKVRPMIASLISGDSGLTEEADKDFFAGRFDDLKGLGADALYDDICKTLFHGPGQLHVRYLTQGEGELHLRTADNDTFGVVNIGDSAALYRLLNEESNPDLVLEREAGFAERLFADVDRDDSPVNVVIGARRFIAGWNSWRVSTMGLMHVGVGEGPEIIQMFGRGVRLKGRNMSLKRHRESGSEPPEDSHMLTELETLRIFGLRANYMQTFRGMLETDGIQVEKETICLPVTWNFGKKDLKIVRLREGLKYELCEDRPILTAPDNEAGSVVDMNLYSRLQAVESGDRDEGRAADKAPVKLAAHHVALFDRGRIYDKLLARKRQSGWHNLTIARSTVEALLGQRDWYTLYAPPERLTVRSYEDLRKLENVAFELLAKYSAYFWQQQRRKWEYENIEVTTLDESDPNNVREYEISIDESKTQLIEDVRSLKANLRAGWKHHLKLGVVMTDTHAYKPLLYAGGKGEITIRPVPLIGSERQVVERLAELAKADDLCLQGRELFLIRNLSRGRGVSFFDDSAYYPDFIVWLTDDKSQHIVFLDPKGLGRYGPDERRKVGLHTEIKDIEERVRKQDPSLRLHAYVLSVTQPDKIGDVLRSQEEWEENGVYFLKDDDAWAQKIIGDVLGSVP